MNTHERLCMRIFLTRQVTRGGDKYRFDKQVRWVRSALIARVRRQWFLLRGSRVL